MLIQIWANIIANKTRSFLTMFGIIWGIVSIIILSAVGNGFQIGNDAVFQELGKNIIVIRNGRTSLQVGGERAGRTIRLTFNDLQLLKANTRLLEHISPELIRNNIRAKSRFNSSTLQMSGIWPVYQYMRTIEVERGRLLNELDNQQSRRVAVLGFNVAKQLFADRDVIDQEIYINGIPYLVVGQIRKKEQDSNYSGLDNEKIFLPFQAMQRDFPLTGSLDTAESISAIIATPIAETAIEFDRLFDQGFRSNEFKKKNSVEREIRTILASRHNFNTDDIEAIAIWNTALESVMFNRIIASMQEFFFAVSLITLALGGIGVMNIMLISVQERTKEIGLRKALGATSMTILWQFFCEGFLLTIFSGGIGLIIGIGLCQVINLLPLPPRFAGMILTWQTALFAVVTLILIGVIAAVYPARRAAALTPIEALRCEI